MRKNILRLDAIEAAIGTSGMKKWLKVIEKIRDIEIEHGQGWGSKSHPTQ